VNPFIVIVEDDHLQEDLLKDQLHRAFPAARIDTLVTEQEFRQRLVDFRTDRPDVIIMDVMLRWAFASPTTTEPPAEVASGGYQRAGFRCAELLFQDAALRDIPVIYYTILEGGDLEPDTRRLSGSTTYVRKSKDHEYLARKVRDLVRPADARNGAPRRSIVT
jgi:CheY-like chemotaxis protein